MKPKLRLGLLILLIVMCNCYLDLSKQLTAQQILDLANQDRRKNGLSQLTLNPLLNLAALAKAQDMISKDYFAHISPEGTKPWYFFQSLGYNYIYAGENLASGFTDPKELENSWMASTDHRANILSPFYSDLGLAVVQEGKKTLVVEFFGSETNLVTLRQ
ncbi:MAG TPA: CAP domain-containing protein [Patescibacteria group bacterium]|jgi:uncharacterized protein YkwD|nr:CAP domain-containing protein [Patescibacteria group bacterium]